MQAALDGTDPYIKGKNEMMLRGFLGILMPWQLIVSFLENAVGSLSLKRWKGRLNQRELNDCKLMNVMDLSPEPLSWV